MLLSCSAGHTRPAKIHSERGCRGHGGGEVWLTVQELPQHFSGSNPGFMASPAFLVVVYEVGVKSFN